MGLNTAENNEDLGNRISSRISRIFSPRSEKPGKKLENAARAAAIVIEAGAAAVVPQAVIAKAHTPNTAVVESHSESDSKAKYSKMFSLDNQEVVEEASQVEESPLVEEVGSAPVEENLEVSQEDIQVSQLPAKEVIVQEVLGIQGTSNNPESVPPVVEALFPKEIGNIEKDGFAIHNFGEKHGFVVNNFDLLRETALKNKGRVELNVYDDFRTIPGFDLKNSGQLRVAQFFMDTPRGRDGVGILTYALMTAKEDKNKIVINIGFMEEIQINHPIIGPTTNSDKIINGPLFSNDPAVGPDTPEFAQERRNSINRNISWLYGNYAEFNDVVSARWLYDKDPQTGALITKNNPDVMRLSNPPIIEIR